MRRTAALLAGALVLILGGCGARPAGVDGDLTDGWRPPPAAQQFRPAAGTCHAELVRSGAMASYAPLACTGEHLAETVAVTDLPATAGATGPAAARRTAYAKCSRRTTAFLGTDWRTAWLLVQPVLPGPDAWSGGARWVRCDVAEISPVDGAPVGRATGLRTTAPPRMSCADPAINGERVTAMRPVPCERRHRAEFAGLYESPRTSAAQLTSAELRKGCGAAIARFTRIPDDGTLVNRVGWLGFPPDDTAWQLGDRAVRCFLWLDGAPMTGSYRNAGPGKLKIQYVYR
jgi:hypothetical protein